MSIKVGDIVQVNMNAAGLTLIPSAEVLYIPSGSGDVWGFRDRIAEKEVWTSEPITICKRISDSK